MAVKVQKILHPIVQPPVLVKPDIIKFGSAWNKLDHDNIKSLDVDSIKVRSTCPFCGYVGQYFAHAIDNQDHNHYPRFCESCNAVYERR